MTIAESTGSLSLDGRVAVVTGGGTGIGRGIALEFARAGADVAIAGRRQGPIDDVAQEIRNLGQRGLPISADASKKADVDHLIERTTSELGDVDILVNNAAWGGLGPSLLGSDEARWDKHMDRNLKSVYLGCHAVAPGMIARKSGNIINISSVDSIVPARNQCRIYGVTKAAINFLTRGLALELAPHDIRVNCIAPGAVRTPMLTEDVGTDEENWQRLAEMIPLGRVGQPNDIGTAALFLASDAANYITAQTITVDAGIVGGA